MGLFKKKAGGTMFGNLLRVASSKVAPGILGTGANRLPANYVETPQTNVEKGSSVLLGLMAETPQGNSIIKASAIDQVKENSLVIAFGAVALGASIYAYMKSKTGKSSYRRK